VAQNTIAQVTTWLGIGTPAPVDSWNDLFPKSQNPAVSTSTIISNKNDLRDKLEAGLRTIYGDIPNSLLTPIDRDTLHLHERDTTPTTAPVPANAPVIAVVERGHLWVKISITDPANPHTQAKPDGVSETEVDGAFQSQQDVINAAVAKAASGAAARNIGPVVPIIEPTFPQESDFHHVGNTGKFLYKINFIASQVGGTEFIRARYLNTRKEPGPWSEIISTIVG
jgi:hypothetical protein